MRSQIIHWFCESEAKKQRPHSVNTHFVHVLAGQHHPPKFAAALDIAHRTVGDELEDPSRLRDVDHRQIRLEVTNGTEDLLIELQIVDNLQRVVVFVVKKRVAFGSERDGALSHRFLAGAGGDGWWAGGAAGWAGVRTNFGQAGQNRVTF